MILILRSCINSEHQHRLHEDITVTLEARENERVILISLSCIYSEHHHPLPRGHRCHLGGQAEERVILISCSCINSEHRHRLPRGHRRHLGGQAEGASDQGRDKVAFQKRFCHSLTVVAGSILTLTGVSVTWRVRQAAPVAHLPWALIFWKNSLM